MYLLKPPTGVFAESCCVPHCVKLRAFGVTAGLIGRFWLCCAVDIKGLCSLGVLGVSFVDEAF